MSITLSKKSLLVLPLAVSASLAFSGCAVYTETGKVQEAAERTYVEAQRFRNAKPEFNNVSVTDALFVRQLSSDEVVKPSWYFHKAPIDYKGAAFGVVISDVFSDLSVNLKYIDGVDMSKIVSVKSDGTVGDAIRAISGAAGYNYSVTENTITFSKFQTKTFDIAMIPGVEEFGVGKKGGEQQQSGGGEEKESIITSTDEYAHTEGSIDIYTDLNKTLPLLLSQEGKYELNPATTSLIVKDYPANIDKVGAYISDQNEKMTRQVSIDMTIIDVQFDDTTKFGVDWSAVAQQLGSKNYSINLDTMFLNGLATTSFAPMTLTSQIGSGKGNGTALLIQALQSQGTVSSESQPKSVTLNNRVAKLRSIVRESYIAEQKITNTINVGSESSITQANVETGFSMYALPKIYRDEVIMRLTTNLSTLLRLEKKGSNNSGGTGTQVLVEAPKVSDKDFDNSVIIRSGDTLLIAGLSTVSESSTDANSGSEIVGVSKSSNKVRVETIIAITPTILKGVRS